MRKMKSDLEIAKFLLKIEKKAYVAAKRQKIEVADKKAHDLVTNYDTFVENFLLKRLKNAFGDVKIVSEEFNSEVEAVGDCFVIDPIDGTVNFANGLDCWGIQIAYVRNNQTVASAIFSPFHGQYYAAKGFGAFKSGKKIACEKRDLEHSLLCIDYHNTERFSRVLEKLSPYVLQQRFFGCACINYIMVAFGKFGVYIINEDAHPWDILPGLLLANEAGCVTKVVSGHSITATSEENAEKVAQLLQDVPFKN